MARILNVFALPKLVAPEEMAGGTAVVIDVLRASTTIVHALEAGAREVIACAEVEDARTTAAGLPAGEALLGGEREGRPIQGFDLGNSPGEYTPYSVGGRTVVFTSTNGTRAMARCCRADRVLVGAFVNATAVCGQLAGREQIHLVCAGTNGQMGEDDILLAGLLVERLQLHGGMTYRLNAQGLTARETWLASFALPVALGAEPLEPEQLARLFRKSPGGKNLVAIGQEEDLLAAAQLDRFASVPELDPGTLRIALPEDTG